MLIVGLGNPGSTYKYNRHNIGYRVIDKLIDDLGAKDISKKSFEGQLFRFGTLFLLKPTTYMNLSGKSVLAVKNFFKIQTEDIVVVHDDIDLPFGAIRIKRGGGNGGHNGLKSIDDAIGREYIRLRVGVGKPEHKSEVPSYVLHDFTDDEQANIDKIITHAATVCRKIPTTTLEQIKSLYSIKDISKL